jgi:glycosyltransferase involved in cell wall biosynthesis
MGLPIVATDAGGTREVLGNVGCIVPIDDAKAMASTLRRLLEKNPERAGSDPDDCAAVPRDVLGQRARQRAIELFDANVRGRELTKHYRSFGS